MKPHDLERFLSAQKSTYQTALNELEAAKKQSDWMWYIFPQIQGLGYSELNKYYAIADLTEAAEYLNHRVWVPG